jgi:hypothetical protein
MGKSASHSAIAPERFLREHGVRSCRSGPVADDAHAVLLGSVRRSMRDGTRPSRKYWQGTSLSRP